jgi:hypothetical protein
MTSAIKDIVLSDINSHESFKNIWIGDSGASCHYCNSDEGLLKKGTISEITTSRNGTITKDENVRKLRMKMLILCLIFGSTYSALIRL